MLRPMPNPDTTFRGMADQIFFTDLVSPEKFTDLVSRETKGVVSKVVDEEKENIGPGCRREDGAEQENNQENADPHVISLSPRG